MCMCMCCAVLCCAEIVIVSVLRIVNQFLQKKKLIYRLDLNHSAGNLVELTLGASLAEMTSLSEFLPEVLATRAIDGKVVSILWDVFAPEGETNISTEHRFAFFFPSLGSFGWRQCCRGATWACIGGIQLLCVSDVLF